MRVKWSNTNSSAIAASSPRKISKPADATTSTARRRLRRHHHDWKNFAGHRSRQQCRSSSKSAQKEAATRGCLSRDEAAEGVRKTLRAQDAREGGGRPQGAQGGQEAGAAGRLAPHAEKAGGCAASRGAAA